LQRRLVNEAEIAERVAQRGFIVLDPSVSSAQEIIDACSEVDIVMGVEGSHLSNGLMWMARSGTLLVLQPPQRFVTVLKDHCDNLGMRYAFIVCDRVSADDFGAAPDVVERTLDRISARAR
jgi:capsular polysaccharide biosynthesis protein